ncbi:MAG: hypothetical protein A2487_15295 [Candidatus Raymondbacteria bacterium RifOxyC12_full_50_8]|uniref:Uncharacterized protein n=1 Tax=Candidatus Raymondbacteria bacterium RIFOXYD12_FULL_49_13 TaxID=1817890 RepID=A0A1F7FGP3_UNCRA|nr:MAG: hypothetical protein A2248_05060 [Candidatus Raymondbacteria bacterium RIFOXYA2_FULL_49_16]OGJ94515.1 MAG: hypothetical protein A2487_15295 [Candidatus Raymondbacteria bacterium RifOxyC12_full_50_8]OGJ99273.1 MAG: hypothetical protein A2350_05360 [Candidatus Raymondbacteria bacterium RifOxyB12_full_50_8]OGK05865.1 MAG: hypothetical protein A2519_04235 [Candidatus Raymondbacteria bacterium RIFOXYD12_FULL_49_13]OGP43359.1 MAG: hypothetical protein A2324_02700 [Candidatus Raymondbacteria b
MSENKVIEKPIIYLDHNIYSWFEKDNNFLKTSLPIFRDELQVVYSSENLKEMAQSPVRAQSYLDILSAMNAWYMEIVLDDNWRITDKARWYAGSPQNVYQEQLRNNECFNQFEQNPFLHKLLGGQEDLSFGDIFDTDKGKLLSHLENIKTDSVILNSLINDMRSCVDPLFARLKEQFKGLHSEFQPNFTATMRKQVGVSPNILNNIQGKGVINRIQEAIRPIKGMTELFDSITGGAKTDAMALVNPNNTVYQTVAALYGLLEMLGYWSDNKIKEERRFSSLRNDMLHAANAIFTKSLITKDTGLGMKAGAIYEYLGITTKVVLFSNKVPPTEK